MQEQECPVRPPRSPRANSPRLGCAVRRRRRLASSARQPRPTALAPGSSAGPASRPGDGRRGGTHRGDSRQRGPGLLCTRAGNGRSHAPWPGAVGPWGVGAEPPEAPQGQMPSNHGPCTRPESPSDGRAVPQEQRLPCHPGAGAWGWGRLTQLSAVPGRHSRPCDPACGTGTTGDGPDLLGKLREGGKTALSLVFLHWWPGLEGRSVPVAGGAPAATAERAVGPGPSEAPGRVVSTGRHYWCPGRGDRPGRVQGKDTRATRAEGVAAGCRGRGAPAGVSCGEEGPMR